MSDVAEIHPRLAEMLDGLDLAFCLFDTADRTVQWNRTFLRFFPEHDGHVHAGEPYADNLRRFYRQMLPPVELPRIERYVRDGVERHRAQVRPFVFLHRRRWLRVACTTVPGVGRYRIWTQLESPNDSVLLAPFQADGLAADPVLESMAEGVAFLNPDGRIQAVNQRFLELYGAPGREDVLGQTLENVLRTAWDGAAEHDPGRSAFELALVGLEDARRYAGAPFEVPLPDDIWVRVVERRAMDGIVCSTHSDISDMKRQQEAMRAARDAADRANRAKTAFLAQVSHEIRTPMNGILGMSSLMLRGGLDEEQRGYAEALHRSAGALLVILNDLLDASKLEEAKLRLETIPFDLRGLIGEMALLLGPTAMEKGVTLGCTTAPALSGRFLGDPTRLRQVLLNLLSNALKFTARGRVWMTAAPGDGDTVRLEVADTGIGIGPGDADRLFLPFEQADVTIARRYGGTGLGLSIARQLVEMMGGRIGAAPRAGGGSLFWCEIPLPRAPGPTETRDGTGCGAGAGDGEDQGEADQGGARALTGCGRVLVVDDNATNRAVACAMLSRAGFEVWAAPDGASAVAMVGRARPDLVLMDLQLPDMDGFEASRRIRGLPTGEGVPVVALTANAMPGDREACLDGGMDDYLPKPFTPAALIATALRWVPAARAGEGTAPGAGAPDQKSRSA